MKYRYLYVVSAIPATHATLVSVSFETDVVPLKGSDPGSIETVSRSFPTLIVVNLSDQDSDQ